MKISTKSIFAALTAAGLALQLPQVQFAIAVYLKPLVASHPGISAGVTALLAILTLLHNPADPAKSVAPTPLDQQAWKDQGAKQ